MDESFRRRNNEGVIEEIIYLKEDYGVIHVFSINKFYKVPENNYWNSSNEMFTKGPKGTIQAPVE